MKLAWAFFAALAVAGPAAAGGAEPRWERVEALTVGELQRQGFVITGTARGRTPSYALYFLQKGGETFRCVEDSAALVHKPDADPVLGCFRRVAEPE